MFYGSSFYEGKENTAAGYFNVTAYGYFQCVNSLYNIVDSFFVAKLSEDAMTALSLAFPVQNL